MTKSHSYKRCTARFLGRLACFSGMLLFTLGALACDVTDTPPAETDTPAVAATAQPTRVIASPAPTVAPVPATTAAPIPKPSLSPPPNPFTGAPFPTEIPQPPASDLIALAQRFRPGQHAALAEPLVYGAKDVGSVEEFWLIDLRRQRVDKARATLQLVTPHALWYTAGDTLGPSDTLRPLAVHFEEHVYPTVTEAILGFVPEQSPQGAGAPITMLIAPLSGAAGYFASGDYYTLGVFPYSNGRPILYLDAGIVRAGPSAFGGLAGHEYQHLLHHLVDPTEHTWVNEGISEVTQGLVTRRPAIAPPGHRDEVSLTNWPQFGRDIMRHYHAADLFFTYFHQRYGAGALSALVARPESGIDGVEAYLKNAGHSETFDDVFQDWAVANLLGGGEAMPYGYHDAASVAALDPPHSLSPRSAFHDDIAPFAADYVSLEAPAQGAALRFQGAATTSILDTMPYSGAACWWSNRGDSTHTRLTREFDLSQVASATLSFRLWHNLETLWDYLYVTASTDDGETWQALSGRHTVTDDPLGATYGPGITGHSGGWVEERMDITAYAGGKVLLAFEQVYDGAISLDGSCIDDIAVPEVGFFDDAETDGSWTSEGFVRTNNVLAQRFGVRVVVENNGGSVTVTQVALDQDNSGSVQLPTLTAGSSATVVVTSLTQHTEQPASYTLHLIPNG